MKDNLTMITAMVVLYFLGTTTIQASITTDTIPSAKEIIAKYINAIGGEAELKKVASISQDAELEIDGQVLDMASKTLAPNLVYSEISSGGAIVVKQIFDGKIFYQVQDEVRTEIKGDDLLERQEKKGVFDQLYYTTDGNKMEVVGTEKMGDAVTYKLLITSASGRVKTEYYDVKTGFLLKEEKLIDNNGTKINRSITYGDYRKTDQVWFPYKIVQNTKTADVDQEFIITVSKIIINPPLKTTDFN